MTITQLSENFKKLDTSEVIRESFLETTEKFTELQKDQLRSGKTSKGESIKPGYRSGKYAKVKAEMNPLPGLGNPDLFLTGKFYSGIDAEPGKDLIKIISRDSKGPDLEAKYPDIFGLGSIYKNQYITESLKPLVTEKISKVTGLKFS